MFLRGDGEDQGVGSVVVVGGVEGGRVGVAGSDRLQGEGHEHGQGMNNNEYI